MKTNACDKRCLSEFLLGQMSVNEEATFVLHLDSCDSCGNELERLAANDVVWGDVRSLLGSNVARTIPNRPEPGGEEGELRLAVRQVLASLLPTDEPASLGRLANFEVLGVIGSGAMGVVLKAQDPSLDRIVALKVMNPALALCGTARQRFARESKAAAAILHPNVIAIHGVSASDELPFLVMPYVTGMSLQQRVWTEGTLSLPEILRIGSQVAAGLAAAHRQGVIHRDIKPSNILLDDGVETALITDFGIARTIDDATMTRTGTITGTPEYMSPEQARGDAIDFKSDLFSLGSVLYRICTGHTPFRAQTAFGVLRRITDQHPAPIRETNPEIPTWLCSLIERFHAKDPQERPTADEAHALLAGCLAHVYQPDRISLPVGLEKPSKSANSLVFRPLQIGVPMLLIALSLLIFAAQGWLPMSPSAGDGSTADNQIMPTSSEKPTEDLAEGEKIFKTLEIDLPQPDQTGAVVIDITRGFVDVITHDKPQVVIDVLNPPVPKDANNANGLKQQFAPQYNLDIDKEQNRITLDTYNNTYVLNLRVKVPKRTDLSLDTYRDGYLSVKGVAGTINTHSQHCDISLMKISGTATAFSYNGDLTVEFDRVDEDADLDFESYNGSIDLTLPANIQATTAVSAGRGTFGSMFEIAPTERSSDPRLAGLDESTAESYQFGTINGGGVGIRIESEKGEISLRMISE